MMLKTCNSFNKKTFKKKTDSCIAVSSLLSRHLLWHLGGVCTCGNGKSSGAGMGPQLQHLPPWWMCILDTCCLLCLWAHALVFDRNSILDLRKWLFQWKLQRKVSVSRRCYPLVEKHCTEKFPAQSASEFALYSIFPRRIWWCRTL